jgi:hypothetical protein
MFVYNDMCNIYLICNIQHDLGFLQNIFSEI